MTTARERAQRALDSAYADGRPYVEDLDTAGLVVVDREALARLQRIHRAHRGRTRRIIAGLRRAVVVLAYERARRRYYGPPNKWAAARWAKVLAALWPRTTAMRAAITAAVGPEVDALAQERDCYRDAEQAAMNDMAIATSLLCGSCVHVDDGCEFGVSCRGDSWSHADHVAALAECGRLRALLAECNAVAAAWVLDRAEQYENSSLVRAAFDEIMMGLARGEHVAAFEHGELDDLMKAKFIQLALDAARREANP